MIWKICLTILSLIGVILGKSTIDWHNILNNHIIYSYVKEICYDICVGIFSTMILVWFIDHINEYIQEKKSKDDEAKKIKCFDRLLQLYIERYEIFYYCVVTPVSQRDYNNLLIPEEFKLKDMKDLYNSTLLMSEGMFDTAIEGFITAEENLKMEIESMIRNVEFDFFPEIRESLESFIEASIKYNQKQALLGAPKVTVGTQTLDKVVMEALETSADEFYEKVKREKVQVANLLHPYVALYEMLKEEYKCIKAYEKEINQI